MSSRQEIQQCVDQCNQLANQLRSMANTSGNKMTSEFLMEGAHHIDLCVTECGFAVQRAQQGML